MFCKLFYLLFFVFMIFHADSFAQDISPSELFEMTLEELMNLKVITASRSERSIEELPVTTHVISREEILMNNYADLVDVLEDLPGIKVSQPGSGTHGNTFLMRGLFGNYYTKILLNGVPIQPSVVDGMPIGEQINMKNVDRIEVIWGPASALYGADALAGVINIITYSPERNTGRVEISIGKKGYLNRNFYMNQYHNGVSLSIYGVFGKREDMNIYEANRDVFGDKNLLGNEVVIADLPEKGDNIGIQITYKDLSFNFNYMYRMAHSSLGQTKEEYKMPTNEIDGYFVTDLFSNYTLPTERGDIQLNLKVTNLFDEAHGGIGAYGNNDLRYNPQYGRMFYGCVGFSF